MAKARADKATAEALAIIEMDFMAGSPGNGYPNHQMVSRTGGAIIKSFIFRLLAWPFRSEAPRSHQARDGEREE
jgi:hypothetical protein